MSDDPKPYDDPPDPEQRPPELDFVGAGDAARSLLLEYRIAALQACITHINKLEDLREMTLGWNATAQERCQASLDNDDISFLLSDRHWLLRRIEQYRSQLRHYQYYLDQNKKKKDDGEAGVTE